MAWLRPSPEYLSVWVKGLLPAWIRENGQSQLMSQNLEPILPALEAAICSDVILMGVRVDDTEERLFLQDLDELRCRMCASGIDQHTVNNIGSRPVLSE
jgi:hypothetical protein